MLGGELQLAFCCTSLVVLEGGRCFPGECFMELTTADVEILNGQIHVVVFQKQLQNEVIN